MMPEPMNAPMARIAPQGRGVRPAADQELGVDPFLVHVAETRIDIIVNGAEAGESLPHVRPRRSLRPGLGPAQRAVERFLARKAVRVAADDHALVVAAVDPLVLLELGQARP